MPHGKIDRAAGCVDDGMRWMQFRAQLEGDSPEHASKDMRAQPPLSQSLIVNTGIGERTRRGKQDSLKSHLRDLYLDRPILSGDKSTGTALYQNTTFLSQYICPLRAIRYVGTHSQCCIPQCSITTSTHHLVFKELQWQSGCPKNLFPSATAASQTTAQVSLELLEGISAGMDRILWPCLP